MPVQVQFQGRPGPGRRRNEHGQEEKDEQDRSHQHHRPDEAEVMQRIGLQEKQRQERTHGGDVAHQERIHLLGQGFPFVRLILQVVHIMERIVHGDADDHGTDAQHDQGYRTLEQSDNPEGEERPGEDGHQDPEDVGKAFITEPQDDTDKDRREGQSQERVLLDAGCVSDGDFGTTGGSDGDVRELRFRPRLDRPQKFHQFRVPARFAAPERRVEKDDAGATVPREQEPVLHPAPGGRIQGFQTLQDRREQSQRIAPEIGRCEPGGRRVETPPVLLHPVMDIARKGQEGVHAGVIGLRQEIGPVSADETEDLLDGIGVGVHPEVGHQGGRIRFGPEVAEGGHGVHEAVGIGLGRVPGLEEDGHPVLSQAVIDLGIPLALLRLRQEGGDVLLVVHPEGGQGAEPQQDQEQSDRQTFPGRQGIVDMKDDPLHRPMSIRG